MLDFGRWPLAPIQDVEVRFEKDLSRPPHAGFKIVNGRTEVEASDGSSTIEWTIVRRTLVTRFELELIEDVSRDTVKPLGKTKLAKRVIKWSAVFKDDEIRERVLELNPVGELEGYLFRVRLKVYDGPRFIEQSDSEPFTVDVLPRPPAEVKGAAATAYHALYEFHASKIADPRVLGPGGQPDASVASVRMGNPDGKEKEARLDVSPAMLEAERALLREPAGLGLWEWTRGDGIDLVLEPPRDAWKLPGAAFDAFLAARTSFFSLALREGCIEVLDLLGTEARVLARAYVDAYEHLLASFVTHARGQGAVANSDRQNVARLTSIDTVAVTISPDDGGEPIRMLLVLPSHPASVAWLLEFQSLISEWTRGRYDPSLKPPFRSGVNTPAVLGGVEAFSIGPRTMVLPTASSRATPDSWGFAGNLTRTWQCFVPVGADLNVRTRDWASHLAEFVGLGPRPIGSGPMDPRRIGNRIKKYLVLHPYVSRLKLAAVVSGDGAELLEALREIDDRTGTPRGAETIRDVRYELTLIGPASERFGRSVDELTLSPGDDRWARYASAILDNPETVLVPGFAYAKRPIAAQGRAHDMWGEVHKRLAAFGSDGLHVTLIGPLLATSIGVAPRSLESTFRLRGLAARPSVRGVVPLEGDAFAGNWLMSLAAPPSPDTTSTRAAAILSDAVDVAHGVADAKQQVGLQVALSGAVSAGIRLAHDVSDWVIIADPLFSIELLDRARDDRGDAVLLDFTPEFDPYPGGRVVVSTRNLREVEAIGSPFASALASTGAWTTVLESISARLLLSLANPTKQVVHGLAGLALSRVYIALDRPNALVVPVDGHEDMFVFPKPGKGNLLADLLAVRLDGNQLVLEVVESKWSTRANLGTQVDHGVQQATTTMEAIRDAYIEYQGVDRSARLDNLREVLGFHLARAARHRIPTPFTPAELHRLSEGDDLWTTARVEATVLAWCPDGSFGSDAVETRDGIAIRYFGTDGITAHGDAMGGWPVPGGASANEDGGEASRAIIDLIEESVADAEPTTSDGHGQSAGVAGPEATDARPPAPQPPAGDSPEGSQGPATDTRPSAGEARPVDSSPECVRLGTLVNGRAIASWCPPRLSNGHLIIIGGSGAGKTTALRHISGEISDRGVPVLVIDFHGDIDVPATEASSYRFDYSGNLSFINPFHLEPKYGAKLTPTRLKWEFLEAWKNVYPTMGVHQMNYLASLIEEAFDDAGITDEPATWTRTVTFGDVLDRFDAGEAGDKERAKIASYMKRFREWRVFHGGSPISVESFLERSSRLDLSQLDESARSILADVVLRRLFLSVRALGPLDPGASSWDKFRIYVVIDEAQILMGSSADAKASLTKYAAEARKFGVGLILATQLRGNVPTDIWGNIDTRLFMQALDPVERAHNAKAANVPEAMLKSLGRGQAILLSSSQPHAAPVVLQIEPSWMQPPHA